MLRRSVLVCAMAFGLAITSSGTALAWDLIATKSGHDVVTLRTWTRGYNQVAFVADHAGTRVFVKIVVECRNGDFFSDTWSDGGARFRFVLGGLGNSGRCEQTFKVDARSNVPQLDLTTYARG